MKNEPGRNLAFLHNTVTVNLLLVLATTFPKPQKTNSPLGGGGGGGGGGAPKGMEQTKKTR